MTLEPGDFTIRLSAARNRAVGLMVVSLMQAMRCVELTRLANIAACIMRILGPRLHEHHVARANLVAAFPEKSTAEIERIALGMWDNIGRLAAEYVHLDRLWAHDPAHKQAECVEADQGGADRLLRLRDDGKPALIFFGHLANYELIGIIGSQFGCDLGFVYRQQHIAAIGNMIDKLRTRSMPTLTHAIRSGLGAGREIEQALKRGAHVGVLIDQHVIQGIEVNFFGRRCKISPMLAKLARRIECPIHGARVIRLPGHRFRCELTEAIEVPRDLRGRIDVHATMQAITSIMEGWVREYPDQWIWAHQRWR